MKWFNLKDNKCPKCGKDFTKGLETYNFLENTIEIKVLSHPCGFKISEQRYKEIVSSMLSSHFDMITDLNLPDWEEEG